MIFETPSHSALLEKVGVKSMVSDIFDELLNIAQAQDCRFPTDFKAKVMSEMAQPTEANSIMYQDFVARRPLEIETYLASPMKLAQSVGVPVPRLDTIYTILHNINVINQQRKDIPAPAPGPNAAPARLSSLPPPARPMMNGPHNGNGPNRGRGRVPSMGPPMGMRRGPPPMSGGPANGYGRGVNGNGYPGPRNQSRRGSLDGNDLEEFSHLVLYDDIPESGESNYGGDGSEIGIRERELMLRQREFALREQEMRMRSRGGPGPRRSAAPSIRNGGYDDDDDEDGFDPQDGPPPPLIDPDNFDMMSVTSRRNRKAPAPNASQFRKNPEFGEAPPRRGGGFMRPYSRNNRSSAQMISQVPGLHDSLMDDPLMGYSSNRYATVDRQQMGKESRNNSLTSVRLDEMQYGGPPHPNGAGPYPRRASQSPGNLYSPQMGRGGRPSPPNGYGPQMNGRPSPPGGMMRQPVPRHPPGQGNSVAPQQVEQYAGVSALHPPKGPTNVRSLTGSASASAGSGDSANIDSEPSAHSSQSSLGPRPPIGVR